MFKILSTKKDTHKALEGAITHLTSLILEPILCFLTQVQTNIGMGQERWTAGDGPRKSPGGRTGLSGPLADAAFDPLP